MLMQVVQDLLVQIVQLEMVTLQKQQEVVLLQDLKKILIVNVGDRVFFGYDSSDLDSDALELLQDQVAWLKTKQ